MAEIEAAMGEERLAREVSIQCGFGFGCVTTGSSLNFAFPFLLVHPNEEHDTDNSFQPNQDLKLKSRQLEGIRFALAFSILVGGRNSVGYHAPQILASVRCPFSFLILSRRSFARCPHRSATPRRKPSSSRRASTTSSKLPRPPSSSSSSVESLGRKPSLFI